MRRNPAVSPLVLLAAVLALALSSGAVRPARGDSTSGAAPIRLRDMPPVKGLERRMANEGKERIRQARAWRAKRHALAKSGERSRPAREERAALDEDRRRAPAPGSAAPGDVIGAVPANMRVNDPSTDGPDAGQS